MLFGAFIFAAGLFAWTLLEYAIHGWMGHRMAGAVQRMHAAHHRDPARVFAIGAWPPVAAALIAAVYFGGFSSATIFLLGAAAGFAVYEIEHYRIHFARPACAYEARMRALHLAHHYAAPGRCFGVTVAWWDRVFGSEAPARETARMIAAEPSIAPLAGRSNLGRIICRSGLRRA
jgi:sterol desaturase/sphingolipid hydroxylase (fatty acid hydroxylase superfamily)